MHMAFIWLAFELILTSAAPRARQRTRYGVAGLLVVSFSAFLIRPVAGLTLPLYWMQDRISLLLLMCVAAGLLARFPAPRMRVWAYATVAILLINFPLYIFESEIRALVSVDLLRRLLGPPRLFVNASAVLILTYITIRLFFARKRAAPRAAAQPTAPSSRET